MGRVSLVGNEIDFMRLFTTDETILAALNSYNPANNPNDIISDSVLTSLITIMTDLLLVHFKMPGRLIDKTDLLVRLNAGIGA